MTPGTERPPAEELVTIINHQLRTPMTKLLCHAELLQTQATELPTTVLDAVGSIVVATTELDDALKWASEVLDEVVAPERVDTAGSSDSSIAG